MYSIFALLQTLCKRSSERPLSNRSVCSELKFSELAEFHSALSGCKQKRAYSEI
ncbi:hypothetical protein WN51_11304 [Melipona quadrifasciata]|uniref:Uncharacterized protein n=1 Tax=Melipona quadrifasciata TaxID=166423 RepID=A0A0N1IU25_9HYME|nr:hypothetical protein WN51_11304 [Melipona quadrifasciata]